MTLHEEIIDRLYTLLGRGGGNEATIIQDADAIFTLVRERLLSDEAVKASTIEGDRYAKTRATITAPLDAVS